MVSKWGIYDQEIQLSDKGDKLLYPIPADVRVEVYYSALGRSETWGKPT